MGNAFGYLDVLLDDLIAAAKATGMAEEVEERDDEIHAESWTREAHVNLQKAKEKYKAALKLVLPKEDIDGEEDLCSPGDDDQE